ncbi:MAG: phosphatidate cytidylyltransferase, partial [Treponema sp.]|nr:phosphatidate cytidylyltransferase [Treponema sp.]
MKKLIQRILLFVITLPFVMVVVVFLPYRSYLATSCIVILLSALGAAEFAAMLNKKNGAVSTREAGILGALGPAAMTLTVSFGLSFYVFPGILMAAFSWLLLSQVFTPPEKFNTS